MQDLLLCPVSQAGAAEGDDSVSGWRGLQAGQRSGREVPAEVLSTPTEKGVALGHRTYRLT